MMTDEKFIEWLRKIKEHCNNRERCSGCVFDSECGCIFIALAMELCDTPNDWDMEEIERIIRL